MKNIIIFSIYDEQGKIKEYVLFLINQLKSVSDDIIIVINGTMNDLDLNKLKQFTTNIIIRENYGYDFWAYKEVLNKYKILINKYDTITLCNDTFFGFFKNLRDIYNEMEEKKCDFWGINYINNEILDYIESYFLVFKNKIINNNELYNYIEETEKYAVKDVIDVHVIFEVGLFQYLKRKNYIYESYIKSNNLNIYKKPYECIVKYNLPILKKKAIVSIDENQMKKIIQYLMNNTSYNVNMILANKDKIYKNNFFNIETVISPITLTENTLKLKIKKYKGVYIYGAGIVARKLWFIYQDILINFRGFVISKNAGKLNICGYQVKNIEDIDTTNFCIIVAMNISNSKEVYLKHKNEENYVWLWSEL